MKIYNISDMKGGWFIGNFKPTAFQSDNAEVSFKLHPKNEKWDTHYHEFLTEINLLIRGKMIIQDKEINEGDIFILEPKEIADPIFLEDCEIVCVKIPRITGGKKII